MNAGANTAARKRPVNGPDADHEFSRSQFVVALNSWGTYLVSLSDSQLHCCRGRRVAPSGLVLARGMPRVTGQVPPLLELSSLLTRFDLQIS
jgi:hypothetical protein